MNILSRVAVITLLFLALVSTSGPVAAPVKVFILSGQSNMVGFGIPCSLAATGIKNGGSYKNIKVYSAVDGDSAVSGPETLRAPLRSHPFFGPEIGIGEILSDFYKNDTIVFIKVAWGGTSLDRNWMSSDSVHSAKNGRNYDLYDWFCDHVTTALQKIGDYHIEGMFWMQGEADAGSDPEIARSYKGNLVAFVTTRIRNDFGPVPFVYGKIQNWYGTVPWPNGAIVQEQQRRAEVAIGNARFVPACGDRNATVYLDSTGRYPCAMQGSMDCYPALGCYFYHYDTRGQVYVGRALGRAMAEMKRE